MEMHPAKRVSIVIEAPLEIEKVKVRVDTAALPKLDMRGLRQSYRGVVVNLKALVEAVARGDVPLGAVMGDEKFLNLQAKASKDTDVLNYPGVVVVKE